MTHSLAMPVSPPLSLEAIHDLASSCAHTTLPELVRWVAESPAAPPLVDQVLATLGVPEPDLDEDGVPVAGSVLRKILHWSQVEQIADTLARNSDTHGQWVAEGLA